MFVPFYPQSVVSGPVPSLLSFDNDSTTAPSLEGSSPVRLSGGAKSALGTKDTPSRCSASEHPSPQHVPSPCTTDRGPGLRATTDNAPLDSDVPQCRVFGRATAHNEKAVAVTQTNNMMDLDPIPSLSDRAPVNTTRAKASDEGTAPVLSGVGPSPGSKRANNTTTNIVPQVCAVPTMIPIHGFCSQQPSVQSSPNYQPRTPHFSAVIWHAGKLC